MIRDPREFVLANTRLQSPPHCPEIQLHLADELVPLWSATEDELAQMGLPPPFWAFAWAGGQALARYVLDHPELVRDRDVFDLASGSGLAAIAAMLAGARSALAADIDPLAAAAATVNAEANGVQVSTISADLLGSTRSESVILVGDLFYDRDIAAPLLTWLQERAAAGALVRVGDPGRSYFPKQHFDLEVMYSVKVTRVLEDAEVKQTGVWRLTGCP